MTEDLWFKTGFEINNEITFNYDCIASVSECFCS
jgi:hypothetical protein